MGPADLYHPVGKACLSREFQPLVTSGYIVGCNHTAGKEAQEDPLSGYNNHSKQLETLSFWVEVISWDLPAHNDAMGGYPKKIH